MSDYSRPLGFFHEFPPFRNPNALWLSVRTPDLGREIEKISDYRGLEREFIRLLLLEMLDHLQETTPIRTSFLGAGMKLLSVSRGNETSVITVDLVRPLRASVAPKDGRCEFRYLHPTFEDGRHFGLYAEEACLPAASWGGNHFLISYERSRSFTHFVSISAVIEQSQADGQWPEPQSIPLLLAYSKDGRTFSINVANDMRSAISVNFEFDMSNWRGEAAQAASYPKQAANLG